MRFLKLIASLALFASSQLLLAQKQTLTKAEGIVVDSLTGSPMPFVTVLLKKSLHGTATDSAGHFSMMVSANDTIRFSFVGYKSLELPALNWESGIIRMTENTVILKEVTIRSVSTQNYYKNLFADQHSLWQKKQEQTVPFYYSRDRTDKKLVQKFQEENTRVKTYMDLVTNAEFKSDFMVRYNLTEEQFYTILRAFNEKNHTFMYYLTTPELLSLLNGFYTSYKAKE